MRQVSLLVLFFILSCSSFIDDESERSDKDRKGKFGTENAQPELPQAPNAEAKSQESLDLGSIRNLQNHDIGRLNFFTTTNELSDYCTEQKNGRVIFYDDYLGFCGPSSFSRRVLRTLNLNEDSILYGAYVTFLENNSSRYGAVIIAFSPGENVIDAACSSDGSFSGISVHVNHTLDDFAADDPLEICAKLGIGTAYLPSKNDFSKVSLDIKGFKAEIPLTAIEE